VYDRVAGAYAERYFTELERKPFDRELLDRFAADLCGRGPVCDLGCGPGHVGRYLAERGVEVFGVDLSPGMVALARQLNPGLRFERGDMLALALSDASLAGLVAFYSLIHLERGAAPRSRWISE
jgi:trans-aconitate methyltransferase